MPPHALDDPAIPDDADLHRRIPPIWWVPDERTGGRRLSTQAFENSRDGSGTSVFIASETTVDATMLGFAEYGLASLKASVPRAHSQGVRRVPVAGLPGHAQIEGRKSRGVKQALVSACQLVKEPVVD